MPRHLLFLDFAFPEGVSTFTFLKESARADIASRPTGGGGINISSKLYMLGAGVPSDHLSTITKNTAIGGKLMSCGYASADKYQ